MPPRRPRGPAATKILTLPDLLERRAEARRRGRTVVQCHGCFDIVHPGHIRHLRQARTHGDILLVTLTGDAAMRKGTGRPLIPQELRAENLAELDCVDWVCIDESETAEALLEQVRPDVYVKGREYERNQDPRFRAERATVERHAGRVVFSSGDVVFSSTALIAAMEHTADPYHSRLVRLLDCPDAAPPCLLERIASFRGRRVAVIGETLLDTYVLCDQPEVASESPVLTLRPLERRTYDGGAAVLARHVAAMGGHPVLVTGLPEAPGAEALRQRLAGEGIEVRSVRTDGPIAEKQRFLVGTQKVMKLNLLEPLVLDAERQDELESLATVAGDGCDAAILADFGNGLLTGPLVGRLCTALRPKVRTLTGDVSGRRASLRAMHTMDLLCPSEHELRETYRNFDESIPAVAWRLLRDTGTRAALVTLGADGLIGFEPLPGSAETDEWRSRVRGEHVPALAQHAVDPLGCGDALLAAATLTLASGGSLLAASLLGSVAAAATAGRVGNGPVSAGDLRRGVARIHAGTLSCGTDAPAAPLVRDAAAS